MAVKILKLDIGTTELSFSGNIYIYLCGDKIKSPEIKRNQEFKCKNYTVIVDWDEDDNVVGIEIIT